MALGVFPSLKDIDKMNCTLQYIHCKWIYYQFRSIGRESSTEVEINYENSQLALALEERLDSQSVFQYGASWLVGARPTCEPPSYSAAGSAVDPTNNNNDNNAINW